MTEKVENKANDENSPAMSFEDALARLEAIVYQLESGSLP
ncbi:MAG: exodeoxyribonuclease VII small subunit, partial [Victivallales bacterium]|nr:exodeoxyribonuclease VII small subunit [Victivallales bacterium]